jgi:serine O-acetyltransferase
VAATGVSAAGVGPEAARDFAADLRRYRGLERLREPSVWAISVYRFGRFALGCPRWMRLLLDPLYAVAHTAIGVLVGIDLPRQAAIGPGLRIYHFGGIIVHPGSVVGAGCTFGHGVTIGVREDDSTPVIEDDVVLSAYAQVLGDVRVGRGAKIGAMSVVLRDVPARHSAAGVPARDLGPRRA